MTQSTPASVVGANVRAEMARRGVSQAALGAVLGFKQPSISARLRGRTPFDINELHQVADFLGVPVETLLPAEEPALGGAA